MKRLFDLVVAVPSVIVLSPVLVLIGFLPISALSRFRQSKSIPLSQQASLQAGMSNRSIREPQRLERPPFTGRAFSILFFPETLPLVLAVVSNPQITQIFAD